MKILIVLLCLIIPSLAFSAEGCSSIGQLASNLTQPIIVVTEFIYSACVILGICALFGSFLRYMQHRVNPLGAPISSVIVLLILGIVLICLPMVSWLTDSGVPYHYF